MALPLERTETRFKDFKVPYTPLAARVEAERCLFCHDAPCMQACPTHIDIPGFIRKIATGNLWGSARTIFTSNILGMSCARVCPVEVLCVGKCVLSEMGVPPVQIGKLQRFATDHAFEQGWSFFDRAPATGRRVALIGAGPSSLACAHELARLGHEVTLFERQGFGGGLNATGIAPYKMRADRALQEVEWILRVGGITLRTGVEVGRDLSLEDLERDFDAIFVGFGLGEDQLMSRLPGSTLAGIEGAVQFIGRMKTSLVELGEVRHAVVVGGGNTAVDTVRELCALGVPSVTLLYRRDEASMKGYAHEWEVARKMGAQARFRTLPMGFEGSDRVTGVRCQALGSDLAPAAEPPFVIPADRVFLAIGQSRLVDRLETLGGFTFDKGRIVVDEQGFTGRPRWFAGGDCVNGGKEVVNASAEGKAAATGIHRLLTAEAR
jgi:glutamate synthase (NADPH/NADH) small chain